MTSSERTLSRPAAQAYYDRFGRKQDSQGFYEDSAIDDLIAHADLASVRRVFEFGCGTGKLAARLLERDLPADASYLGCDISPVMVGIARERMEPFGERAQVIRSDGAVAFAEDDHSVDRVMSCYVLDLLPDADIRRFFAEAHRVLGTGGRVCLASLTRGISPLSRAVSSLWAGVFRLRPALVGGCRPIWLEDHVDARQWRILHRHVVTPFGVPSEVMIAETRYAGDA